ncbi:hypothetical protein GCM10027184_53000 [Saccharothrix stipae]
MRVRRSLWSVAPVPAGIATLDHDEGGFGRADHGAPGSVLRFLRRWSCSRCWVRHSGSQVEVPNRGTIASGDHPHSLVRRAYPSGERRAVAVSGTKAATTALRGAAQTLVACRIRQRRSF